MGAAWSASHDRQEFADRLQAILDALEISELALDARLYLQKIIRHCDLARSINPKLALKGEEKITVLLRTVFESANGAAALTLPILDAVSTCLRPVWVSRGLGLLEALDQVDLVGLHSTLAELGLADQVGRVLYAKIEAILGPPTVAPAAKPAKVKAIPKPARSITRIPEVERNMSLGVELIAVRATINGNVAFGRAVRARFDIDAKFASQCARVARRYAGRFEIFSKLSWNALVNLSAPSLSAAARHRLEKSIIAGERVGARDIRRARGRLPTGRPRESAPIMQAAA